MGRATEGGRGETGAMEDRDGVKSWVAYSGYRHAWETCLQEKEQKFYTTACGMASPLWSPSRVDGRKPDSAQYCLIDGGRQQDKVSLSNNFCQIHACNDRRRSTVDTRMCLSINVSLKRKTEMSCSIFHYFVVLNVQARQVITQQARAPHCHPTRGDMINFHSTEV